MENHHTVADFEFRYAAPVFATVPDISCPKIAERNVIPWRSLEVSAADAAGVDLNSSSPGPISGTGMFPPGHHDAAIDAASIVTGQ